MFHLCPTLNHLQAPATVTVAAICAMLLFETVVEHGGTPSVMVRQASLDDPESPTNTGPAEDVLPSRDEQFGWRSMLDRRGAIGGDIPDLLPSLPGQGLDVNSMLARHLRPKPSVRTASQFPVDHGDGQKLEEDVDVVVPVRGGDFVVKRMYSSKINGTSESGPGMVGLRWSMNLFQSIKDATYPTVTDESGGQHSFRLPEESTTYIPVDSHISAQRLTKTTIDLDLLAEPAGAEIWPVWRLEEPGEWIKYFHRVKLPSDPETAQSLSNSKLDGVLLQQRDMHNNQRTFTYVILSFGSSEMPTQSPRIAEVYLNPNTDTLTNPAAKIVLNWHGVTGGPSVPNAIKGKLNTLTVLRGTEETQKVTYLYKFDGQTLPPIAGDIYDAAVGTTGDLIQIRKDVRTNVDNEWYSTFTQYRYHNTDENETASTEPDEDEDGFIEYGGNHQLKAVLLPEQIEYAAAKFNDISSTDKDLPTYADDLLKKADGATAYGSFKVTDLACKWISRYDEFNGASADLNLKGRVREQYVKTAVNLTAGEGFGLKLDYEVLNYNASPNPLTDQNTYWRTCIITESKATFGSSTTYAAYRKTYYDLLGFIEVVNGTEQKLFNVGLEVVEDLTATPGRRWITKHEYDEDTRLLMKSWTPASLSAYSPGIEDDPGTTSTDETAVPTCTTAESTGLVVHYDYTGDYRLNTIGVAAGQGAAKPTLTIRYGENSGERAHLPYHIIRHRTESTGADHEEVTDLTYAFHAESAIGDGHLDAIRLVEAAVEAELVTENGPGSSTKYYTHEFFDVNGDNFWSRDAVDSLTFREFDEDNARLTRVVLNTNPDSSLNSSGATAGSFSGRHGDGGRLEYLAKYDDLGRITELTQPSEVTTRVYRKLLTPTERSGFNGVDHDYLATIVLPHKFQVGTPWYLAGPATVVWQSAGGIPIEHGMYSLVAASSSGHFHNVHANYGYDLTISDTYCLSRTTVQSTISGLATGTRHWHSIAGNGEGSGKYESTVSYDTLGRVIKQTTPNATILEYDLDVLGRPTEARVGTLTSNMEPIVRYYWDSGHSTPGQGVGNGLLTVIEELTGESTNGTRRTDHYYDQRNRLYRTTSDDSPDTYLVYDHLDRVTAGAVFENSSSSSTDGAPTDPDNINASGQLAYRGAYMELGYSQRGLPYRTRYAITPTSTSTTFLESHTWYTPAGAVAAQWEPSSPAVKVEYDGLGRNTKVFVTDRRGDAAPGASGNYADVYDADPAYHDAVLAGDVVVEETSNRFIAAPTSAPFNDPRAGLVDLVTTRLRSHLATDSNTGSLAGLDSNKSITTYTGMFYDLADRLERSVDYGTNNDNGTTNDIADDFVHGGGGPTVTQASEYSPSIGELVFRVAYHPTRGLPEILTDEEGHQTKLFYDDLSRTIAMAENWITSDNRSVSWSSSSGRWTVSGFDQILDENKFTSFVYDWAGRTRKMVAHYPDGSNAEKVQVTEHAYGTNKGTSASSSLVKSNELLNRIIYPEEAASTPTEAQRTVTFEYNRVGEVRYKKDQIGNEHVYAYDRAGRLTLDHASNIVSPTDSTINALTSTYDLLGRLKSAKSISGYGGSPTTKNAVTFHYDSLWQVLKVYQNPLGEVDDDGTGGNDSPAVVHTFSTAAVGSGNWHRPTQFAYPGYSTIQSYHYGATDSLSDRISRTATVKRGGTAAIDHAFIGLGKIAVIDYVQPDVQLDYSADGAGSRGVAGKYPGYDRFGRIGKQMYVDGRYTTGGGSGSNPNAPQIHYRKYTYDKLSNRLADTDARPGITNSPTQALGSKQFYDGLNRLKQVDRGITVGSTWTWGNGSQQMALDVLGNFQTFKLDADANGTYSAAETETRTHDGVNQFTGLDTDGTGNDRTLEYDHGGNFTKVTGTAGGGGGGTSTVHTQHTYDAWNRLVKVERRCGPGTASLKLVAEYQHNALGWRVVRRIDTAFLDSSGAEGDGTLDQQTLAYYNERWQLLREEIYDEWSASTPGVVDRWVLNTIGLRGVDEVLSRSYHDGSGITHTYHLHDPQFSTVAVLDVVGGLIERVDYSPWGSARHHPKGDVDGDGDGPDKQTVIDLSLSWCDGGAVLGNACYHAEADLDRDGDIDSADVGLASSKVRSMPPGHVGDPGSGVFNTLGWSGSYHEHVSDLDHLRMREWSPHRGRWLQRDPAGYMDSMNLYAYGWGNPVGVNDPFGLQVGQQGEYFSSDPVMFGSSGWRLGRALESGIALPQVSGFVEKMIKLGDVFQDTRRTGGMMTNWEAFKDGLDDAWTIWEGVCNRFLVNDPDVERAMQYTLQRADDEGLGGSYRAAQVSMTVSVYVNPMGTGGTSAVSSVAGAGARAGMKRAVGGALAHAGVHANAKASTRVTILYGLYHSRTGVFLKWGVTSNWWARYPIWLLRHVEMVEYARGSRAAMLAAERWAVEHLAGPWNLEPWARYMFPWRLF